MLTRDACGGYDDIPLCMRWLVPVSGERTMSACVEVVSLPPWRHALEVQRFDPIGRTGCRVYGDHIQLTSTLNDDEALEEIVRALRVSQNKGAGTSVP